MAAHPGSTHPGSTHPGSTYPAPTPPAAIDTLGSAWRCLQAAAGHRTPGERYAAAHLAALRGASAVLATRTGPERPARRRIRTVWALLAQVAPELGEWAAFFAAGAPKRAAAEAGLPHAVTVREADDLLRDAETFLTLVEEVLARGQQVVPGTRVSRAG